MKQWWRSKFGVPAEQLETLSYCRKSASSSTNIRRVQLLFATALCAAVAITASRRSFVIFKNADFRNTAADSFWKMLWCSGLVVQDKSHSPLRCWGCYPCSQPSQRAAPWAAHGRTCEELGGLAEESFLSPF